VLWRQPSSCVILLAWRSRRVLKGVDEGLLTEIGAHWYLRAVGKLQLVKLSPGRDRRGRTDMLGILAILTAPAATALALLRPSSPLPFFEV